MQLIWHYICSVYSTYCIAEKFCERMFCNLRVDSLHLYIDINDFLNKLLQIGLVYIRNKLDSPLPGLAGTRYVA